MITLEGFGSICLPWEAIDAFFDDFQESDIGYKWTVEVKEMTKKDYLSLPEFKKDDE